MSRKDITPRRAQLLKKSIRRVGLSSNEYEEAEGKAERAINDVALRKTSEEYFRKLEGENVVKAHSHSRKVSWNYEDEVRMYDIDEPPTDCSDSC